MNHRKIIITAPDHARLHKLVALGSSSPRERSELHALDRELASAEIVASTAVPPDVITMNSRAELSDLDTGECLDFVLVFPEDADVAADKISVLAPIGAGMLGYRVGDTFERQAPNGLRRLRVTAVTYQPEAAFAATM